jgi:hypothetical protein
MSALWKQSRTARFRILHADHFTCRYCGGRPGCDLLEVDHLIPRSLGGSDHPSNLVTACKTCNSRKSNAIFFPHDLIERVDDDEGWWVHKTYGEWSIVFCHTSIGVDKHRYGFIDGWRLFDQELIRHLYEKRWDGSVFSDMERAFEHLRQMLVDPRSDEELMYGT